MRTLYLDTSTNDIDMSHKQFVFTHDSSEYILQKIKNRLLMFKNDWFLNVDLGLPYFESILVKNPDINFIKTLYSNEILKISGITNIEYLNITEYNLSTRTISIDFKVIYDNTVVAGVVNL